MPTPSAYERVTAERDKLREAYRSLFIAAQRVSDAMKQSPGGDAFTFEGSINHVELLRVELYRTDTEDDLSKVAYGEDVEEG